MFFKKRKSTTADAPVLNTDATETDVVKELGVGWTFKNSQTFTPAGVQACFEKRFETGGHTYTLKMFVVQKQIVCRLMRERENDTKIRGVVRFEEQLSETVHNRCHDKLVADIRQALFDVRLVARDTLQALEKACHDVMPVLGEI